MKTGLVGPSYSERSLSFDAQRTINFYPELNQSGKEISALYGTPGLSVFCDTGLSKSRGLFASYNGRVFYVAGSVLYEVSSLGVATVLGTLASSLGLVSFAENPTQLMLVDGTNGYIFTYSSNTFVQISDLDFPVANNVTFLDSYFIVNSSGTTQFFVSAVNDGTVWSALDFASAESSPDKILKVIAVNGELWLLGERTTEVWSNTGDPLFPFQRASGGKIDIGIFAPETAVSSAFGVIFVSRNAQGDGIVYQMNNLSPKRISNPFIERQIHKVMNPSLMSAYMYQEDGHTFYVLTGGDLETSLVYDLTTDQWHERAYSSPVTGLFEQHLGVFGITGFNKTLVAHKDYGKIYDMSLEYTMDDTFELIGERVFGHLNEENKPFSADSLEIAFEAGVGTQTGQGLNPRMLLYVSKDDGRTWFGPLEGFMGKVGEYKKRVIFRRLGTASTFTFRVRIADPVKRCLIGGYLNA
jgi:hypothetical protein